jgi:hypothetical protein
MEYVLAIGIFCFEGEPSFVMAERKRERETSRINFREREKTGRRHINEWAQ